MANAEWNHSHERWEADCLAEFNERFGEKRTLYVALEDGDYEPGELVEFAENGDAHPHGIGGIGYLKAVVTPWEKSKHYLP